MLKEAVLAALFLGAPAVRGEKPKREPVLTPAQMAPPLQCLNQKEWWVGHGASAVFASVLPATVPDTSGGDGEAHLLVLSLDGKRGALVPISVRGDGVWQMNLESTYTLRRDDHGWQVEQGNGNSPTYEAVRRFVQRHAARRMRKVSLSGITAACEQ